MFSSADQPRCATTAGVLPLLCSPIVSNVVVTKTLIDGGAGLNVLSVETFNNLQVPYSQLQQTKPFSRITDGSTVPIGQVRLPITFGARDNYRTELIDFDVAHIRLPYNAILGYPVLAKFMAVTHHSYNVLKMPGSGGIIMAHVKKGMRCAPLSVPSMPRQSTTLTAEVRALRRHSPRRSYHAVQDPKKMASHQEPRQDRRPL